MPHVPRRTLPLAVVLAVVALGAVVVPVGAYTARFTSQSVGDRGADVRALQYLLSAAGTPVGVNGVFTAATATSVRAFQTGHGLTADGIVGDTTWAQLAVPLASGSHGPAVLALQTELRAKRRSTVVADGVYRSSTITAVRAFQAHAGLPVNGRVDAAVWRYLIGHFRNAAITRTGLCDYSVGNGLANWGTATAIETIEAAARHEVATGHGRVALGDASREHGGVIAGHDTHRRGLDVDVRLLRKDRAQCRVGTNYRQAVYDRAATRGLIRTIRALAPGHVKLIYFNDPVLIREGLTRRFAGHDDHLHVRFCEPLQPDPMYRC